MLHQKKSWLIGGLLLLWSFQATLWAKPKPASYDKLLKKTVKKLNHQVLQNRQNDREGKSHLNNYVIQAFPESVIETKGYKFVQPGTLTELKQYLVNFNKKNAPELKLYVMLVGNIPPIGFEPKQILANETNYENWTVQRLNERQVKLIEDQANSAATKAKNAQFMQEVYSRSLLNGRIGSKTALLTVLSEMYIWHPIKYTGDKKEPFSIENISKVQIKYWKGFSHDEALQYICSPTLHPERKQLNIRQGLRDFAPEANLYHKKLFRFSEDADMALRNFVLLSTACMDPAFFKTTNPNQLPGSTALKAWLPDYLKAGQRHVQGNNEDEDFKHLSGVNYQLCKFLQERSPRNGRIRGWVQTQEDKVVNLYAYTSADYNASANLGAIDKDQQLIIDKRAWVKADKAETGNDNRPVQLFKVSDTPLTYLTRKKNGHLAFYTEGFTAQEAQLAYRVINRGLHHFLLKDIRKTTITTAGNATMQSTQYEKIDLSDDYKTIQLFKEAPARLPTEASKLLQFLNIAPAPTEQKPRIERRLLVDACKACITDEVLADKKVGFNCTLKLAQAYLQYELAHDRLLGRDAPDLMVLPALTSQGLSLLQVIRGAMKRDGSRVTAGLLGLLKNIPQLEKISTIYSFIINIKEGNITTAILQVVPSSTSLLGLTGAIGLSVGITFISKFLENPCNWFWSLSRQLVCKFEPHLDGNKGLQVAKAIVQVQGGSNVRKLLRNARLIELIKGLGLQSTRHRARLLLEDMSKNTQEGVPRLLREMLKVPEPMLPDYIESWRYLTRTRSRARIVRRNPHVLDAVTRYRRSPLFAAIRDTLYLVEHFDARSHYGCPNCASFEEDVEFLLQLESITGNRVLLNRVADNFLTECGKNANAAKGVNWALELVARTHHQAGVASRSLTNQQKTIKAGVNIPRGRKMRPLVGNLNAIEFQVSIPNHSSFRDRKYDYVLASPNDPRTLIYIDAKNISFAKINSRNFRNEIKKDILAFANATQGSILYLFKNRDIPDANALHQTIFRVLTDARYGFLTPDYLSRLNLENMGFGLRRNTSHNQQIMNFVTRKFILLEN